MIRRQIARVEVWNSARIGERPEIVASRQIGGRIHHHLSKKWPLRRCEKIGISGRRVFDAGIERVASIAIGLRVDEVASEPYESPVLSFQIQRDRRNCETLLNFRVFIVTLICMDTW